jgi:MFS family permease
MSKIQQSVHYKWYMLSLAAITATVVVAIPFSCMPPLFKEISGDLGLSLIQIGTIWGIANLAGVFISLAGGFIGDRFGIKLIMGLSCILVGITGALRGLSVDFLSLTVTVFLNGLTRAIIPIIVTKTISIWFRDKNLALANGIGAMGMGLGLMLGPMISATYLSPMLGGWRNVLILYGSIAVVIGLLWFILGREPPRREPVSEDHVLAPVPLSRAFSKLIRNKALWLIGLAVMFRSGCITGMIGYLPLYLRDKGLSAASADNSLTIFFAASTICVIPLSLLSDRIGSRKVILFPALIATILCVAALPYSGSITIWLLMVIAGIFFDGFMSVLCAMIFETQGVSTANAGTALGLVFTIGQFGGVITPPLGNSLADINPGAPFIFWSAICVAALVSLVFIRETGRRKKKDPHERSVSV